MSHQIIIVGGGIVGLATAYQLLKQKPNMRLLLLEKENSIAKHQTGNNSGVIHSGLYYKPGSLKAKNCIDGYKMLLDFCNEHQIPYELCGKIVVATEQRELPLLKTLEERGKLNGLEGIKHLNKDEIKEHEPHCSGIEGLFVPQTGIINYKQVCEVLAKEIEKMGGEIKLNHKVISIDIIDKDVIIVTPQEEFVCEQLVNCSGLYSDKVAEMTQKVDTKIIPFRGEYYELKPEKQYLVKNLIYPVPDPNFPFLGVHFTRMISGGIEAGPNAVLAFAREGYKKSNFNFSEFFESVTYPGFIKIATKYWQTGMGEMYRSFSKRAFTKALQRLLPELTENDLIAGSAGVRAQACHKTEGLLDDFKILETPTATHIINAPSPAATSSLSIGATVSSLVLDKM